MRNARGKGVKERRRRVPRRPASPAAVTYELWNASTRNMIQSFQTEAEALAMVRLIVARQGVAYADRIVLASEDREGRSQMIAQGQELVGRAGVEAVGAGQSARELVQHA